MSMDKHIKSESVIHFNDGSYFGVMQDRRGIVYLTMDDDDENMVQVMITKTENLENLSKVFKEMAKYQKQQYKKVS